MLVQSSRGYTWIPEYAILPLLWDFNKRSFWVGVGPRLSVSCCFSSCSAWLVITVQLYYSMASNILKQLNCFPGGRSGLIEGPRSGCLGNAVAVWSSCPLKILLQFIAEAFFFLNRMSNIVFETSSTDRTLGRKSQCDLVLFEYWHGWVLGLSSRQSMPWYKLRYVKAKKVDVLLQAGRASHCASVH